MCLCSHRSVFSPVRPDLSTFNSPGLKSRCSNLGCGLSVLPTHSVFTIITQIYVCQSLVRVAIRVCVEPRGFGEPHRLPRIWSTSFLLSVTFVRKSALFCDSMSAVQHHLFVLFLGLCLVSSVNIYRHSSSPFCASNYCWNAGTLAEPQNAILGKAKCSGSLPLFPFSKCLECDTLNSAA